MKKHILGLTIFSFIFASFTIAFAIFYSPNLPMIAEVGENINVPPIVSSHGKTSCSLSRREKISVQVISSQYFSDEDRIISEIKLVWKGSGITPERLYLTTFVSNSENKSEGSFDGVVQILENPFQNGSRNILKVTSRGSNNKKIKMSDNLYVVASVNEYSDEMENTIENTDANFSDKKEVVFVHGESSIIGK